MLEHALPIIFEGEPIEALGTAMRQHGTIESVDIDMNGWCPMKKSAVRMSIAMFTAAYALTMPSRVVMVYSEYAWSISVITQLVEMFVEHAIERWAVDVALVPGHENPVRVVHDPEISAVHIRWYREHTDVTPGQLEISDAVGHLNAQGVTTDGLQLYREGTNT